MKKIKHSKYKNTGMLFELLTRQITSDIISSNESIATEILKKFFNKNSELLKEYSLYKTLCEERFESDSKATILVEAVLRARKANVNKNKLKEEKYELIKTINENFKIEDFFQTKVQNYKLLASIYKIFEYNEVQNPAEITRSKVTIIENMVSKKSRIVESEPTISNEPKEIRLLSYKILVEKFNTKYEELSQEQKTVLREYISNVSNTNNLKDFIKKEANRIQEILVGKTKKVKDKTLKIKLAEVIELLNQYKTIKTIDENHVSALLRYYNLINDL